MSTEPIPELNLDDVREAGALRGAVNSFEEKHQPLAVLSAAIDDWEHIRTALCAMRAANISALLQLKPSPTPLEDEEILQVFSFLREWDQLLLSNILVLCEGWIPMEVLPVLQAEAKIETKWFQEWLSAASDRRIHKYPGLPWRSFIRKVVNENYLFATHYLELAAEPATPANVQRVQQHFSRFLESKKKVLAVFPKRLNKNH